MSFFRLAFAMAALVLTACGGSHKSTVNTAAGTATVTTSDDNKTTTMQTKEGTFTTGEGAVNIAKLSVPVYPGAKTSESGGYAMTGRNGDAQVVSLTSPDAFAKVYAWYRAKMPSGSEKFKVSNPGAEMAEFVSGSDGSEQGTVMIQNKGGQTLILISHNVRKQRL